MAWNFQDFHLESEKIASGRCRYEKIRFHRLDLELEPDAAKEFRIGNHRGGLGVATDLATEPALDLRHVRDVIEVAMSQQKELWRHALGNEPFAGALRRVEKDRPLGRMEQIAVRLEDPAAKRLVAHSIGT